ncbi:hypothetical protein Q4567_01270 [Aliiglaciecola sp. 2_MG-2023]|uniref:hypothetical protein n=1 Tax=unclassified Aliiglaciecola TaxID=2593648 RepID=UPI0026E42409|nr:MULTISPECIES: hypothetical protein [unclassified Aliiglaciecola]MDO6709341.1 hypothetical protein [Aliiglaciecola sp. 2_MG-2023]MDO6750489.1 hypothetical protein [Aliiglaciecola sp. 1_MG-2023]
MMINWTNSIWKTSKHSAFTDLCEFADKLFVSFREASDHMSQDGDIRIVTCDLFGKKINSTTLKMANCDLRDPKLTVMPDGKLLMTAYARCYDETGKWRHSRSLCWFSQDGLSWSSQHWFAEKNWWVWRIRWQGEQAYGFAYKRAQQQLNLYKGNPLRTFDCVKPNVLSLASHGLGYPNESDLCFMKNGDAYAVVRRDADSFTAQCGFSKPPYNRWQWFDLQQYIGAPVIISHGPENILICGRAWLNGKFKTALWQMNIETNKLILKVVLPSGGDCSYAGMVRYNEKIYVSYYSSHIDNQSHIYLAQLNL